MIAAGCDDDDGDDGMSGLLLFAMGRTCCCCIVLGNSEISDDLALSWDDNNILMIDECDAVGNVCTVVRFRLCWIGYAVLLTDLGL